MVMKQLFIKYMGILYWTAIALLAVAVIAGAISYTGVFTGETALKRPKKESGGGHAYISRIRPKYLSLFIPSDSGSSLEKSRLELFEDGKPLGPAHGLHPRIREKGMGAYSHWCKHVIFSSSDNSDPSKNGRIYTIRYFLIMPPVVFALVLLVIPLLLVCRNLYLAGKMGRLYSLSKILFGYFFYILNYGDGNVSRNDQLPEKEDNLPPTKPVKPDWLGILANALVLMILVFLLCFCLEYHFRQEFFRYHALTPRWLFSIDEKSTVRLAPNLKMQYQFEGDTFNVSITNGGYRGTVFYPPERKDKTVRILTDGSSFTFGWRVNDDETWPYQLERLLAGTAGGPGISYEVINAGCPLIGANYKWYLSEFSKYDPDLVMLVTFPQGPSELLEQVSEIKFRIDSNGYLILDSQTGLPLLDGIIQGSYTLRYLRQELSASAARLLASLKKGAGSVQSQYRDKYLRQTPECLSYFINYKRALDMKGIPLFVGIQKSDLSITVEEKLIRELNSSGIHAFSLRDVVPNDPVYFTADGHWNARGNRLIAQKVHGFIISNMNAIKAR
jgi:hypothetical protein